MEENLHCEEPSFLQYVDRFLRKIFSYIVRLYQVTLSQFFGSNCRFHPTCSNYALRALQTKSLPRAFLLIGKRLSKCHPYHPGGYDPVK